ncbi:Metal-dependent hydrolase, endonuclease/exonuclease/phosphatase family [Dyella sp. OK004]|uniref:endonuclease/exonuclease/phosphatase family protein n=1 Tax=Dyella sp. OK004 TaxID=1855292 RepID=UPI0008E5F4EB|nr:endonuclease/exonuclease/phosphatase family protein [Dyella sp. OK004]SFS13537.1 Metal-dependent hydrolase, endonuclease/exonuclease/phosphatase family [Dyella sp. OK004]
MTRLSRIALALAIAVVALPAAAVDLKVMTFNVRTMAAQDGPNGWDKRRDLFADTIRQMQPDVIGTQELYKQQGDDTVERLPQYTWFGRDRFGGHGDEHMGIFYRKDRLKLVESGDFWLSDTPDKVASITWGNVFPRMVNWALFEHLPDHKRFYLLDTHFPYRDQDEDARSRGAREIAAWIAKLPPNVPVIFTGDFNTEPRSEAHTALTASLKDAWDTAPKREGPAKTFHDFTGKPTVQIDWILYRGVQANAIRTITTSKDGRYPSDHFPVQADFTL